MSDPITLYGFTAVPASAQALLASTPAYPRQSSAPAPIPARDTPMPNTPLAVRINSYAKAHLPEPTYNHSLRVYHYGLAIKRHRFPFPDWAFSDETYFLACVLHDIGTAEEHITATRLSFEFHGGFLALDLLLQEAEGSAAPREQAESVAEAIIRHQDLCTMGKITAVGQLLQLATIFGTRRRPRTTDNTGAYADLVHPDTITDVSKHYPRHHWSQCFAATIRRENSLKPWAHTTALGEKDFPAKVLENELMKPFE
ncbi:HD domain containing protein [Penicillium macrosclerotiorum]|uniref:HD domain containing protein n=1 Tax=Penicillium macrosclerotiorum TaxID=303699 RepID=UPI002546B1D2|nr:HD domain containing protein [Penicillium macrosclerotiorum]KAJ5682264.1 HD domain containing protein [Penicillium macrosclerotiorum]